MGLEETGEINEELFYMLLAHIGGTPYLVGRGWKRLVETSPPTRRRATFGAPGSLAQAAMTFSEELATRTTAVQRMMLADYLTLNDQRLPRARRGRSRSTTSPTAPGRQSCSNGGDYHGQPLPPTANRAPIVDNIAIAAPEPSRPSRNRSRRRRSSRTAAGTPGKDKGRAGADKTKG